MKYPVCVVSSIISPGKYFVVSTDKEHVTEVIDLEDKLRSGTFSEDTSQFELCCEMCVAVMDSDGRFKRGVIKKKLGNNLYEVFLMDYGQVVQVNKSVLKVITDEDFMKVEPLAFVVKLYGLIPVKYVTVDAVRKPRACKEWKLESKVFVQNIFKKSSKVVVQSILIQQRTVYGDLFTQLKPDLKFVSLRKLLCKNEYCVYSESHFLPQENLDPLSQDLKVESKMELVEKWQRENFGEGSSFQLPVGASILETALLGMASDVSAPKPVCDSTKQSKETSVVKEEISEADPGQAKMIGMGRGKLKLLIEEMKKNQLASSSDGEEISETKISLGRGNLKKYLENKSKLKSSPEVPQSSTLDTDSKKLSSERFSDVDHETAPPENVSKVERAVVKPGDVSEFSGSNELTEISLSTEDEPPPLVRNLRVGKGACRYQDELSESKCDVKSNSRCPKLKSKSLDLKGSQKKSGPWPNGSRKIGESEKFRGGWNERGGLEESWMQVLANSYWAPYVLFDDSVVEPVKTFAELPIKPSIIKNLKKKGSFNHLSQVQRWAIPSIRKQLNTIVIGSSGTGKTLSYAVPLMDYIQDEAYFEELPQGNGPAVVIVASSTRTCEWIYYLCRSLLGHSARNDTPSSEVKVVMAHGGGCEKEVWVSLTNGCDVLISTPHCLVRLLEMPVLTNFDRLTCLVLDEIDVISQNPFRKNTRIILEKARVSAAGRHHQRIFCGEKWTGNVESLVKAYAGSYALVIGSYSEAVVFEGLKPCICLVSREQKAEVLAGKLKDMTGKRKTVVVCEGTPEAVALRDFLAERGIPSLLAHENLLVDKLKEIRGMWKSSKDLPLIQTDGVLAELNIREAETLIHYGLPSKSKTNFYLRYLVLEGFLRAKQNSSKTKDNDISQTKALQDIILIDDENHYQLPHIVDFIVRLKGQVPTKILEKCQEIRRQIEIEKRDVPVCEALLSFGRCRDSQICPRRHALLKESDSRGSLPGSGWVSFVVLRTRDPCCFSAKLTEHTDPRGTKTTTLEASLELPSKVSEFYRAEDNRRSHGVPEVGDVCAVKSIVLEEEVFYRAKVIECLERDKFEKPLEVRVKLLDRGDVWKRKVIELYELPEELSSHPPTAVDVRLVGLQPADFDVTWSGMAEDFAKSLMTETLEENQYWSGKIILALNNTLFLEPIERRQFLPHLDTHVFDMSLRGELLNHRIAVPNESHLPSLLRLCSEGGLDVPDDPEEAKTEESTPVQPQWAFLEGDLIKVKFLAAENTSTVFLQAKKFEKQLSDLEEDCQREGGKTANEIKAGKRKSFFFGKAVSPGTFCLALFEDGRWNRGRIESLEGNEVFVFFVDHGDFLFLPQEDVIPISKALLLRLPCQAVECRLAGIKEEGECSMEILKKMYAFSEDGSEDLYGRVVRKDLSPKVTKGRKYSLNLLNKDGVSLNKMLVNCEMVCAEESEREHLEDVEVVEFDDGGEESEEKEEEEEEEKLIAENEKPHLNVQESNFNLWADDLFEDENAQEFLKEFASKMFNLRGPSGEKGESREVEAKEPSPEPASLRSLEKSKEGRPPGNVTTVEKVRRLIELHKKRLSKGKRGRDLELKGREGVLTPRVLWSQNQLEIEMKILLGNIRDYALECTVNNISFRCLLEKNLYGVDFRLYGAINPQVTKITLKTFHVVVVLTKLAFPLWPRLHVDEGKLRWINLDVERLADKEGVFSEKIRSAKLEIESGMIKEGKRNEKIFPCSDSEDSEVEVSDVDDSESDS